MSVREYIGARYVPVFADPIEWDDERSYEPLTVVTYLGNSYTSRQSVPVGIPISNDVYWALTANYNAQIESYRAEVQAYDGRITDNTNGISAIDDALPIADFSAQSTVKDALDGIEALLPSTDFDAQNTVKDALDGIEALLPSTDFDAQNTVKDALDALAALLPDTDFTSVNTVKAAIDAVQGSITSLQNTVNSNQTANNNRFVTYTTSDFTFPTAINTSNTKIYGLWDKVEKVFTLSGLIMFSTPLQTTDAAVLTLPNQIDSITVEQNFYSCGIKSANASPWVMDNIAAADIKFSGKNMILASWGVGGQPTVGLIFEGVVFPLRNGIATA